MDFDLLCLSARTLTHSPCRTCTGPFPLQVLLYPVFAHMALLVLAVLFGFNPTKFMLHLMFSEQETLQEDVVDSDS